MPSPTRVLVCDDSNTFASALVRTLERGEGIEVVGIATTAEAAFADLARLQPDLITMDIDLPGMSGLEAVEEIMSARPTPILIVSSLVSAESNVAAAALASGALDAISKEAVTIRDLDSAAAVDLRRRVKLLGAAHVIRHPRARLNGRTAPIPVAPRGAVIGICASTGGPHALATLLAGIPATFAVPILVVQHISAGFSEGLARWLNATVPLPVRLADDGLQASPGVSVAPDGADLLLGPNGVLALDRESAAGLHRPSADVLLRSIAEHAQSAAVAVVLTGMGRDGADGLGAVRDAGGLTIAQDEATSAVYGMPREAAKCGAELILPIGEIAQVLTGAALARRKVAR